MERRFYSQPRTDTNVTEHISVTADLLLTNTPLVLMLGVGLNAPTWVTFDSAYGALPEPERGYTFIGWFTAAAEA